MEFVSGNIFIRVPKEAMKAGETVLGHAHNFDHTTVCLAGALEISMLKVLSVNAEGQPVDIEVEYTTTLRAGVPVPWHLILKGRRHMLKAVEDGTVYGCFYAHQMPQALTVGEPGGRVNPPYTKRDDDGTLWVRVDENIVQETSSWVEAYR